MEIKFEDFENVKFEHFEDFDVGCEHGFELVPHLYNDKVLEFVDDVLTGNYMYLGEDETVELKKLGLLI